MTLVGACALGAGCEGDAAPGGAGGGAAAIRTKVVFGSLGDSAGLFTCPRAIDADAQSGTLWVIDKSARVQQLDPKTGRCLSLFRMPESKSGKPTGVTVAPGEGGGSLLYVPDTHYHRVMIYRPRALPADWAKIPEGADRDETAPELVASFGEYGTGPGQFIYPTDVAVQVSADGKHVERLYVTEYGGNDRVSVFDGQNKFLFSFGSYGSSTSADNIQFDRPQSIALDRAYKAGAGQLIVTDSRNDRVGRFTLDGKLIAWLGIGAGKPTDPGHFRIPYGLALLGDGTALVAEFGNNRVQRFDVESGESLGIWGRPGRGDGEVAIPWGVAVMGNTTYVLDTGNNRVLGFATPSRR